MEQLGTKRKFWYSENRWLFKEGRGKVPGENWAEVVAARLCHLLGLPYAHYDFAFCRGRHGVVTPNFADNARLILGNELLPRFHKQYDGGKRHRHTQYTLARVRSLSVVLLRLSAGKSARNLPARWTSLLVI